MNDEERFFKLEVNFGRSSLNFYNSFKKIDFANFEEELSYFPVDIKLYEVYYQDDDNDEQDDNKELIATIDGIFYDMDYAYDYGLNLFNIFDMENGDTALIYDALFDGNRKIKEKYRTYNNNIFYLDRIYVEKKYRNKGYAKLLLNQLDDIVKYMAKLNVGIIVVCSQPFEKEGEEQKMITDDKKLQEKLNLLYKSAGFKKTNNEYNYLVKVIE